MKQTQSTQVRTTRLIMTGREEMEGRLKKEELTLPDVFLSVDKKPRAIAINPGIQTIKCTKTTSLNSLNNRNSIFARAK